MGAFARGESDRVNSGGLVTFKSGKKLRSSATAATAASPLITPVVPHSDRRRPHDAAYDLRPRTNGCRSFF
jgi:hypothetical protein